MDCTEVLSELGEAEFEGESFILVGRVSNLSGLDNTVSFFAAINRRAIFPAPVVIIPVHPASELEDS